MSFAFLAIAIGAIVFAVYAVKERRRSSRLTEEPKPDTVVVDKEGWETKESGTKARKQTKASNVEERQKKSDDWVPGP